MNTHEQHAGDVQLAEEQDHTVTILAFYRDVITYTEARMSGCAYWLETVGRLDLLADQYSGVCDCGAAGPRHADWKGARWWCREHRTSLGMDWQPTIPEDKILDC